MSNVLQQFLALVILAAQTVAPTDPRQPDAVEVFHCGFEPSADEDYDGWPDHWTRKRGPAYPGYQQVQISEENAPEGASCLRMTLNGGAVQVSSPKIEVASMFSYVLEGYLKTEGLVNDDAYMSMVFMDAKGQPLGTFESQHFKLVREWMKIQLGPVTAPSDKAQWAVIELHVEPRGTPDLKGVIWFDDIWLGRLPRISLSTNSLCNVYSADSTNPPEITCQVSGILERDPVMSFELLDCSSQSLSRHSRRLEGQVVAQKSSKASTLLGTTITKDVGFAGTAHWTPEIKEPGYYRVRVVMSGQAGVILERETRLAVLPPLAPPPAHGEFGWCLPDGDHPLSLAALSQLLPQVGINWVKFPVWSTGDSNERLDQLMNFSERLGRRGVQVVGVLDRPPPEVQNHLGETTTLLAADVFSTSADVWYPSLEPIMTRLSLQMKWWQLGLDDDISFVGYPNLQQRIADVKKTLRRFGQRIFLGFGWRIINADPDDSQPPWDFLSYGANPQLTDAELSTYLAVHSGHSTKRWLSIEPLSRRDYSMETRASDLIRRMVAARMDGADAVFIARPFDDDCGLMGADGTPGELFLPWRTAAAALSGTEYLGSLRLPGGSTNHVFSRGNQVMIVLWNATPCDEAIFLGDDARQIDVWGREQPLVTGDHGPVFHVGPLPSLLMGASEPIVRWNLDFTFSQPRMASMFGVPHENEFVVKNFFPQGVGGEVKLLTPESWKTYPRITKFKLGAGEELRQPFTITLPFDATAGRHEVRVDVRIEGDRACQFSIYRSLEVGFGDVELEVSSHLNAQGELEVEQKFTNHEQEPVSFKCMLFAPERRRLVAQVIRLGQAQETKVYRFPHGSDLVGKTLLLRAEEINGHRILNQRFVAQE